jgi:hypothetical protein
MYDTVMVVVIICLATGIAGKLLMPVISVVFSGATGTVIGYLIVFALVGMVGAFVCEALSHGPKK